MLEALKPFNSDRLFMASRDRDDFPHQARPRVQPRRVRQHPLAPTLIQVKIAVRKAGAIASALSHNS